MTSRERVQKAIRGEPVDRLPVSFELAGQTDLKELYFRPPYGWKPKRYPPFVFDIDNYEPTTFARKEDEWGVIWEHGGTVSAAGIDVEHPLQDLETLKSYRFPDPWAEGRFDGFDRIIGQYPDTYLWASNLHLLFERLHFLHGFNETLMDLVQRPAEMEELLDQILQFQLGLIQNLGARYRGRIQAFSSTDDWGTNTSMLISPALWRRLFKPRYARIAEEVHRQGMDFWLHSDGKIEEIIPDLIEIGVEVLNLCDPLLLGIQEFGRRFAGKACFTMYIDVQKTAISGNREEVEREASALVEHWTNAQVSGALAMDYRDMGCTDALALDRKRWALSAFHEAYRRKAGRKGGDIAK
jgi:uroporphyrinogen decarboxylase